MTTKKEQRLLTSLLKHLGKVIATYPTLPYVKPAASDAWRQVKREYQQLKEISK